MRGDYEMAELWDGLGRQRRGLERWDRWVREGKADGIEGEEEVGAPESRRVCGWKTK